MFTDNPWRRRAQRKSYLLVSRNYLIPTTASHFVGFLFEGLAGGDIELRSRTLALIYLILKHSFILHLRIEGGGHSNNLLAGPNTSANMTRHLVYSGALVAFLAGMLLHTYVAQHSD